MALTEIQKIVGSYARLMDFLTVTAFVVLTITFGLYVTGLLPPFVSLARLPLHWGSSVSHYLGETGVRPGWAWVGRLGFGDFLNFLPLAFLGSVIALCYAGLALRLFRARERLLGALALIQIIILALAASGLFRLKGH